MLPGGQFSPRTCQVLRRGYIVKKIARGLPGFDGFLPLVGLFIAVGQAVPGREIGIAAMLGVVSRQEFYGFFVIRDRRCRVMQVLGVAETQLVIHIEGVRVRRQTRFQDRQRFLGALGAPQQPGRVGVGFYILGIALNDDIVHVDGVVVLAIMKVGIARFYQPIDRIVQHGVGQIFL